MNRTIRLLLVGVGLIVIVALGWFFLINPIRADIADTSTQIEDARAQLSVAQAKLAQAEVTRAEGKKNQARIIELAKMIPAEEEIASLLIQIQDLASQSGIAFMSITPAEALDAGDYRIIPLAVEFTGTFFDLSDFIWRAEQMVAGPGRLLAVKQLDLQLAPSQSGGTPTASASASPSLTVSMTMYAFDTAVEAGAVNVTPATQPASPDSGSTSTSAPSGI